MEASSNEYTRHVCVEPPLLLRHSEEEVLYVSHSLFYLRLLDDVYSIYEVGEA